MSLKHAILVMLKKEPGSGYDLLKHFRGSLGYFWNAKHQQIYRQLKQLYEEGLILCKANPQSEKPDKKVYDITAAGVQELGAWMKEPAPPNKINDALLVKIYGTSTSNKSDVLEELIRHIEIHNKTLSKLREIEKQYLALNDKERKTYQYPYLTLRRGIIGEQAWLEWAEEAIQLFKN